MFKFRLQRVLDLRERKERDAATALVSAEDAADGARQEQARLELARQELAARRTPDTPAATLSVGELRNIGFLLERLDERVAVAQSAAAAAEAVVEERRGELQVAFRDRRTLDRLRERHLEGYRSAEAAADRQLMDEIALTRFTQGGTSNGKPNGAPSAPTQDES
jgi:flagellar FliJ protein